LEPLEDWSTRRHQIRYPQPFPIPVGAHPCIDIKTKYASGHGILIRLHWEESCIVVAAPPVVQSEFGGFQALPTLRDTTRLWKFPLVPDRLGETTILPVASFFVYNQAHGHRRQ
jgi:hypothetical protein